MLAKLEQMIRAFPKGAKDGDVAMAEHRLWLR